MKQKCVYKSFISEKYKWINLETDITECYLIGYPTLNLLLHEICLLIRSVFFLIYNFEVEIERDINESGEILITR